MNFNFPFLGIFIIFIIWTTYELKKSSRIQTKKDDDFWIREHEANLVRRKSVNNLDYIQLTKDSLPKINTDNEEICSLISAINNMAELKILNLTGKSNTDLKSEFGPANLPFLSECDENFTQLCRTLNSLGKKLAENDYIPESIKVYEFAISIGSDVSACYYSLAELYVQTNRKNEINSLIEQAEKLNSLLKDSIIKKLTTYL